MAYIPCMYNGYPPGYYGQPVPDQLAQLRQQQQMMCTPSPSQMPYAQNLPREIMPQAQQVEPGGIIWVMGEAGAKAYLVAPGCTVQLWDRESNVIYLKSADMSGAPSMRILDYTERGVATQSPTVVSDTSRAVTIEELESILNERFKQSVTREELESILNERFRQFAKGDTENGKSTVPVTKKQQPAPQ